MTDTPTTPPATERPRMELVYVGVQTYQGKKLYIWNEIIRNGPGVMPSLGMARQFAKSLVACTPGAIYKFAYERKGTATSFFYDEKNREYIGGWWDKDQVIEWTAASRANDRAILAAAQEKKEVTKRLDLDVLEPFHRAYEKSSYAARAGLLTLIIEYIIKGR